MVERVINFKQHKYYYDGNDPFKVVNVRTNGTVDIVWGDSDLSSNWHINVLTEDVIEVNEETYKILTTQMEK
jgi:hypothetical protein